MKTDSPGGAGGAHEIAQMHGGPIRVVENAEGRHEEAVSAWDPLPCASGAPHTGRGSMWTRSHSRATTYSDSSRGIILAFSSVGRTVRTAVQEGSR